MADAGRDFVELKQEVIEARNQAIKTDHQVKNVALDIKGFEKRFDTLERRTRLASIGANAIVALTIAIAALVVTSIRSRGYEKEIDKLQGEVERARTQADEKEKDLASKLRAFEEDKQRRAATQAAVLKIVQDLDAKRDKDAAELLPQINVEDLTPLERRLVDKRIADLRKRASEAAYRVGRSFLNANRHDSAIKEFARSLRIESEGAYAEKTRYLQATTLYHLGRYDQAEPLLRQLREQSTDKALVDESRFLLGTALAHLDKRKQAKAILEEAAAAGQYQRSARTYLAALESGSPLPGPKAEKKSKKAAPSNGQANPGSPRH